MSIYNPLDPATLSDPYPVFAILRAESPVFWHQAMRCWTLTRYRDSLSVLRDHEGFARDRRRIGDEVPSPSLSVQSLDPPAQNSVRGLFMNALRAQDLDAIEQRATEFVDKRLEDYADCSRFDVMQAIAPPLAIEVISDLLGVAPPDIPSFVQISDAIMRSMDGGLDQSVVEPGRAAREKLSSLVDSWFRASPRYGLLAHVAQHGHRDTVPDQYIHNTARVMFQGGYSTVVAAIGNVTNTLMSHPWVVDELADPVTLQTGINELIRFDGPVQGTSRFATKTTQIGNVTIDAGQTVLALLAAANHDPDEFQHPNELILDRSPNRHLGFGWGTHSCIGTIAAQAALRALIAAIVARPKRIVPAGPATRTRTATMRRFTTLPVRFDVTAHAPVTRKRRTAMQAPRDGHSMEVL
jgi:cytochrome P450